MKENRETRERLALLEMKNQEMEQAKRKKGSFKFFSRSSKNMEEEIKKELEVKSRARKIDVKALEDSRKERAIEGVERGQKDFRHLLRKTDQPQERKSAKGGSDGKRKDKTDSEQNAREQRDFRNVLRRTDQPKEKKNTKSNPRSSGDGVKRTGETEEQITRPRSRVKRGKSNEKTQGSELTGSWDFIPSPPSSTVDLIGYGQEDDTPLIPSPSHEQVPVEQYYIQTQQQEPAQVYGEDSDIDGPYSDEELEASSPIFDLSSANTYSISTGVPGPGSAWEGETIAQTSWNQPQQDFDYETQF